MSMGYAHRLQLEEEISRGKVTIERKNLTLFQESTRSDTYIRTLIPKWELNRKKAQRHTRMGCSPKIVDNN